MLFTITLFLLSQAQFIPLELNNLFYPISVSWLWNSSNEDESLYNYNIQDYGITNSSTSFTIGVWVKPAQNESQKQLVISLNYQTVTLYNINGVFCMNPSFGCYYQQEYQSWIYIYYENNADRKIQQICFLENSQLRNPQCFLLPKNIYFIFTFFQSSDSTLINWKGNAFGITIKQNNYNYSTSDSILDYFTMVSSIEPLNILHLRIFEKVQTKVLYDKSASQHFVQLGSNIDFDSNDPKYNNAEQSIQFGATQFIKIENFSLKETCTIQFQISSNNSPDQYCLLSLYSAKLQSMILQLFIIPKNSAMIISFPYKEISFQCILDVQNLLVTTLIFISLPDRVKIALIQSNQVLCIKEYLDSLNYLEFTNGDTLIIGAPTNTNSVAFSIYSLRMSQGFYSPSSYLKNKNCLFSIDQCITCLNYLYNGECLTICPPQTDANPKRMECIPKCHSICETCSSTNLTQCITCAGKRLNPPDCICPPGYFDDGITPDCIRFIPDRSIDSGILEFQCNSVGDFYKRTNFSKQYFDPPKVAISLLGHIDFDLASKFQLFVSEVQENFFNLKIVCTSSAGFYKIQWMASQSPNLQNITQVQIDSGSSFKNFTTTVNFINQIIASIIGWIFTSSNSNFYANFEQQQDQECFTSDNDFNMLQYQIIEFRKIVRYQIFSSTNFTTTLFNSSVGRTSAYLDIDLIPLSIPCITFLNYMYYPNVDGLQYYITEVRKQNQIQYDFKTTQHSQFQFLQADLLIAGIQCSNMTNYCDYYQAMKLCSNSSWNCGCQENQYYDKSYNTCVDCDLNCLQCIHKANNCVSCPKGHQYTLIQNNLTANFYCGCTSNQYMDNTTKYCTDCSSACATCDGSSAGDCTSCDEKFNLTLIKKQCLCKTNEYTDENDICQPCYQLCLSCISHLKTDCINCYEPRYLNPITKLCECQNHQYEKLNQCYDCNKNCQTCFDDQKCLTCADNRSLQDYSCECNEGYFENENLICLMCKSPCKTCSSQLDCLSCINKKQLLYNKRCYQNTISKGQNQIIENPCGNGFKDIGEECDDGNYLPNDGCFQCLTEDGWYCSTTEPSICSLKPYMILKYRGQIQTLQYVQILFSNKIKIKSYYPLSETMSFKIYDVSMDICNVSLINIQDANEIVSSAQYLLSIEINQNMLVEPILEINLNQKVMNEENIEINNLSLNITLKVPIFLSPKEKQKTVTFSNFNKNINIGITCFSAITLFMGSSSLLTQILDMLQYQSYLKYINVVYPVNLEIFLSISDLVSISPIVNFLHLDSYILMVSSQASYGKFIQYQLETDLFTNLISQFLQIFGIISLYVILKIIHIIILRNSFIVKFNYIMSLMNHKGYKKINKILFRLFKAILKLITLFNWERFQDLLIINSLDLIFKVFLQLEKISFTSFMNIIESSLAISLIIIYVFILFSPFIQRNKQKASNLKLNQIYFNAVMIFRIMSFLALLVFFQDSQPLQLTMIILNSFCYVLFLKYSNLIQEQQDFMMLINDFTILFFTILSCSYIDDFKGMLTQEQKQSIGFIQIIILSLSPIAKVIEQMFGYGKVLLQLIKNKINSSKQVNQISACKKNSQINNPKKKNNIADSRVLS